MTETQTKNLKHLNQDNPVFIVPDDFNAWAIIEAPGGRAIVQEDPSGHDLIEAIMQRAKRPPLILAPSNNEQGRAWADQLENELKRRAVITIRVNLGGDHMNADARDSSGDRAGLHQTIAQTIAGITANMNSLKLIEYKRTNSTAAYMERFRDLVRETATRPAIATGFKRLDNRLDGGLYDGLYILGAISSLGKTTFVLQMADNIALRHDVLIFCLEMSRYEMVSKSISRLTAELDKPCQMRNAKTTRGILNGALYANYTDEENNLIDRACVAYSELAKNVYIIEGDKKIGADEVRQKVREHMDLTGKRPVVFIDYLQIMKPADPRQTDKMNTDQAVSDLKRISRDYKIPVVAISSFNRSSYNGPVTLEAFKESGAIEYASDVLIGLQVKGADEYTTTDGQRGKNSRATEDQKRKDPREIELKILKNRNGAMGDNLDYQYYPKFNLFVEGWQEREEVAEMRNQANARNKAGGKTPALSDGLQLD